MLGTIGHLAILLGWVACGLSIFAYFQTAQTESIVWRRGGRSSWYVMGAASLAASGILMHLIMSRSEEHTSELQSRGHLVCRLLLEKNNTSNVMCDSLHA